MAHDELREVLLETVEQSLEAQLRAVRRLRSAPPKRAPRSPNKGLSQVDMAFDILSTSPVPLHISDLIVGIHERFSVQVDRESLVSSLSKKIARGDRFERTAKNTFALLEHDRPQP